MLLSVVRTYRGDHRTYALQIVQWMYVGPPDVRYILGVGGELSL
jgi:hypothetical protein